MAGHSGKRQLESITGTARTKRDHWVLGLPRHRWYTVHHPNNYAPGKLLKVNKLNIKLQQLGLI